MKCPNCKNDDQFYVEVKVSGNTVEYYGSDGNYLDDGSNSGFYDDLKSTHGKYFYCSECDTKVKKYNSLEED